MAKKKVQQPAKKAAPPVPNSFAACYDRERRTCIQVDRQDGVVKFIPLDATTGLEVLTSDETEFDQRYKPMVDYPVERAAKLYISYAQYLGASEEVLKYLGKLITITKQEFEMATKKKPAGSAPAKKAPAKAPAKKAAAKPAGEKKESAAQMFQELIMEGKLTDDKIFEKVQAKFGLDDKKRSYVAWYRNYLTKQGKKPPAAKE